MVFWANWGSIFALIPFLTEHSNTRDGSAVYILLQAGTAGLIMGIEISETGSLDRMS